MGGGMANLQLRNIPDELYERLRKHAVENSCTVREMVLTAIEHELRRLEWEERWARDPKTDMGVAAATLIAEARDERCKELLLRFMNYGVEATISHLTSATSPSSQPPHEPSDERVRLQPRQHRQRLYSERTPS